MGIGFVLGFIVGALCVAVSLALISNVVEQDEERIERERLARLMRVRGKVIDLNAKDKAQ
jgi:hypothetical protein